MYMCGIFNLFIYYKNAWIKIATALTKYFSVYINTLKHEKIKQHNHSKLIIKIIGNVLSFL